jgi:hypothetical protein
MDPDKHRWAEELAEKWKHYTPPSRPSESEVEIYEKYFREVPAGGSVLILGSTAEFRDLAAKYKLKAVLCDWSEKNMEALGLLMKEKPHDEVFSKQDWREMDFPGKFDLVVGDAAFTVVQFEEVKKVAERVSSLLKENGVSLQRIWTRSGNERPTLEEMVARYEKKPTGIDTYGWMIMPLFMCTYHYEGEWGTGTEMMEWLDRLKAEGKLPGGLWEGMEHIRAHNAKTNVPKKETVEGVLKKYFEIIGMEHGNDHFSANTPIYVLKRKV